MECIGISYQGILLSSPDRGRTQRGSGGSSGGGGGVIVRIFSSERRARYRDVALLLLIGDAKELIDLGQST